MKQATGIVIKVVNYRDYDRIISILSEQNEIISILARGVRSIKSKRAGSLQLFTKITADIVKTSNSLYTLRTVKIVDYYHDLKNEFENFTYYNYFLEMIFKVHFNSEDQYGFYDLLQKMIELHRKGNKIEGLRFLFDVQLLKYLGLSPQIKHCSACHKTNILTMDARSGGYICHSCYNYKMVKYSQKSLIVLKQLVTCDVDELNSIKLSENVISELKNFFKEYMIFNVDFNINTLNFL